jgi:hypothetical protein
MALGRNSQMLKSFVDRIKTIKTANGYDTNVMNVFNDEIPMGLDLDEYELPAVLVIAGKDKVVHQHGELKGNWVIELQLIHISTVSDSVMLDFTRDVHKAIYADSASVHRNDAWRVFNGQPTAVWILENDMDLNMIQGNRFAGISYLVQYHAKPTDL